MGDVAVDGNSAEFLAAMSSVGLAGVASLMEFRSQSTVSLLLAAMSIGAAVFSFNLTGRIARSTSRHENAALAAYVSAFALLASVFFQLCEIALREAGSTNWSTAGRAMNTALLAAFGMAYSMYAYDRSPIRRRFLNSIADRPTSTRYIHSHEVVLVTATCLIVGLASYVEVLVIIVALAAVARPAMRKGTAAPARSVFFKLAAKGEKFEDRIWTGLLDSRLKPGGGAHIVVLVFAAMSLSLNLIVFAPTVQDTAWAVAFLSFLAFGFRRLEAARTPTTSWVLLGSLLALGGVLGWIEPRWVPWGRAAAEFASALGADAFQSETFARLFAVASHAGLGAFLPCAFAIAMGAEARRRRNASDVLFWARIWAPLGVVSVCLVALGVFLAVGLVTGIWEIFEWVVPVLALAAGVFAFGYRRAVREAGIIRLRA